MKKILVTMLLILFTSTLIYASEPTYTKEYESPVSIHEPNYFLFGGPDDQTKFKISIQYNMIYDSKLWYIAYSQESFVLFISWFCPAFCSWEPIRVGYPGRRGADRNWRSYY